MRESVDGCVPIYISHRGEDWQSAGLVKGGVNEGIPELENRDPIREHTQESVRRRT